MWRDNLLEVKMYDNFIANYPSDSAGKEVSRSDVRLKGVEGFSDLAAFGVGVSFGRGILRVHSEEEMCRAQILAREVFPEYNNRILPIAKDWLGRQYVGLLGQKVDVVTQLLLLEPGSGEAFEIDCGIVDLFNVEFVADPITYLASDLFEQWVAGSSRVPAAGECVGFKVPLFLGGDGAVENLEVTDEEVYWSIFGQLKAKTRDLPPGTGIASIHID
jgi:hypothetical protein